MKIGTIERAIFPEGKAVLVARDETGRFLLGLTCHPKTVWRWARRRTTTGEKKRLFQAVKEHYPQIEQG
jgi:hypothetical protein